MNKAVPAVRRHLLVGGLALFLAGCCDREADRKVLDAQPDFYCPRGSQINYEAWSECGLMKVCVDPSSGMKNGSQFAAQGGQLQSKALYSQGKSTGNSTWYDRDGKAHSEGGGYQAPAELSAQPTDAVD
jgi:hypothetical protein